jgi:hypothetical protein
MRRLTRLSAVFALLAIVALAPACRTKRKPRAKVSDDDGQLASVVVVADSRSAVQLVRGFHNLEGEAWRWTMKSFTVTLRPPAGAAENGAKLELKFVLPEVIINRLGAMTLSAKVNGTDLPPETFSKTGDWVYTREIPASALHGDAVTVDFAVDKAIPPSEQDSREVAIIVTSIGLTQK